MSAACRSALRDLLPWYLNGSLEGEEAGAVRRHLAACAHCAAELEDLGDLADLVRVHGVPIDHRARAAAWPAVAASQPPRRDRRLRWSLAGGIAALLAVAAVLALSRLKPPSSLPRTVALPESVAAPIAPSPDPVDLPAPAGAPIATLARLDLGAGPVRGEETRPVLRLSPAAQQVEVRLVLPGAGADTTAHIEDVTGRPITGAVPVPGHDAIGRAAVVFPAPALRRSGAYVLVLSQRESSDAGGSAAGATAEYRYPFRIEASDHLQSPAATNAPQ